MNQIERYILIWFAFLLLFLLAIEHGHRKLAEGKLEKMNEFKSVFMPNPSNVFPDAETTQEFNLKKPTHD